MKIKKLFVLVASLLVLSACGNITVTNPSSENSSSETPTSTNGTSEELSSEEVTSEETTSNSSVSSLITSIFSSDISSSEYSDKSSEEESSDKLSEISSEDQATSEEVSSETPVTSETTSSDEYHESISKHISFSEFVGNGTTGYNYPLSSISLPSGVSMSEADLVKCYGEKGYNAVKLGSSSGIGSLKFTLNPALNVAQVIVNVAPYTNPDGRTDEGVRLKVTLSNGVSETLDISSKDEYVFTFGGTDVNTITIETLEAKKRAMIEEITICVDGISSSTSSSSISKPSSSSEEVSSELSNNTSINSGVQEGKTKEISFSEFVGNGTTGYNYPLSSISLPSGVSMSEADLVKCYGEKGYNAVKLGSSSGIGSLKFTLNPALNVAQVIVNVAPYTNPDGRTDEGVRLKVTLSNGVSETLDISSKDEYVFTFGGTDVNTITIETLEAKKRAMIEEITICVDGISSSTSSSSISKPSSSSEEVSSESSSSSTSSIGSNISDSNYDGNYYSSITDSMTGGLNGTLRKALTSLIKPKAYYTYSGTGSNTLSSVLQEADEDPNNSSNMIYFYTQKSVKKNAASSWNREHTWPQSKSGGLYGKSGGGADILHIRPTFEKTNNTRDNYAFGDTNKSNPKTYDGIIYGYLSNGYFEPLDCVKGDCARITLYMWVCYFAERGTPITNNAQSIALMVKWANEDLPSEIEINRNNFAENSKQQNRNPFVDHPEWVNKIFG